MGAYKYISTLWRNKDCDAMRYLSRIRAWEYRHLPSVYRVARPTRPEKAHMLGFKHKQGFVVYRVRVRRGGRKRVARKNIVNRKPRSQGIFKQYSSQSLRVLGERKVGKRCANLRVLNSYWINQDGMYKYYEVIMVDGSHPVIQSDPQINWICKPTNKRRETRGLTSAGKQSRGLLSKSPRTAQNRPSTHASWKRRNTTSLLRYR